MTFTHTVLPAAALLLLPAAARAQNPEGGHGAAAGRPIPLTIGIGAGISTPSSPLGVNTGSARLVLSRAITLEPILGVAFASGSAEVDTTGGSFETRTKSSDFLVGTNARFHATSAGPVDLVGIAGLGVTMGNTEVDPEGTDNNTKTATTTLWTAWGLGVEFYPSEHWSISADATNPLVSWAKATQEDEAAETETTGSTTDFGVQWTPTIRFMGHLYF